MNTGTGKHRLLLTLAMICIIFLAPYLMARYFFRHPDKSFSTVNHGQLIQPPLAFSALKVSTAEGTALPEAVWRGHWTLLYFSPQACQQRCQQNLYHMRQIRLATGKEQNRIQRLLLTFPALRSTLPLALIQQQYSGTQIAFVLPQTLQAQWGKALAHSTVLQQGGMLVVDPSGNIMMFYLPEAKSGDILKDLTRLLRVSQIG